MKLQGFKGRSRGFSSPAMESELQYVNHREQLKTFKQENPHGLSCISDESLWQMCR